jgi:hypothetical protein
LLSFHPDFASSKASISTATARSTTATRWLAPTAAAVSTSFDKAIALYNSGSAGTRSGAEDAFLRLNFPEPLVNTDLHGFEVDFHWPDLKLAVEIDGPHHGRPHDRDADARQDRALQAAGYKTIRFTDEDVYQRPEYVMKTLEF